jgi:tetratricopeptide (TPR) repeat protein
MDLGRTSQAWDALETARKLDPISVSTLSWVITQATDHGQPEIAEDAMRILRQVAPASADYLHFHLLYDNYRYAEAAIALEDFRAHWPNEDPHDFYLSRLYAVLGKVDEAMALRLESKARIASELGQRELALSAMEEAAAKRTDPHDRADLYWYTYVNLGMYDEALEVLSDLWYGYAAEDISPRMDPGDALSLVMLLRRAGRADEAAPIAAKLIEIWSANETDNAAVIRLMEGDYEEALRLFIERAKNGRPPVDYTGVIKRLFVLKQFPEYETLKRLVNEWIEEQRALYEELTAARASTPDAAHP